MTKLKELDNKVLKEFMVCDRPFYTAFIEHIIKSYKYENPYEAAKIWFNNKDHISFECLT